MNEKFKHVVDTPSPVVDAIIDNAMFHSKKEEARHFLTFMDNYICYYLNRKSDELCFPIIRISSCPNWIREVFLKYLTLRLSIYYNKDLLIKLEPNTYLNLMYIDPEDREIARMARKQNKYVDKWNAYKKAIKNLNSQELYLGENGHKNLIFCTEQDLMVSSQDKNIFIQEFYGPADDIITSKNLCICHDLTSKGIRMQLKQSGKQVNIDNIFVFYTNNDSCNSLERTSLERMNDSYNTGIRNCFVFDFSKRPFRMHRTYRRGVLFSSIYPMISEKEFKDYGHYTVLKDDESRYLFNIKKNSYHKFIDADDNKRDDFFNDTIGSLLENVDYKIQERNNFSLCVNEDISSLYQEHLKDLFPDYAEEDYKASFYYQHKVGTELLDKIANTMVSMNQSDMAIVIDSNVPKSVRHYIRAIYPNFCVHIYDYSALKPKKNDCNIYVNNIKEDYVVVLQYRPHYATAAYSKYPNSFDPYCVNPGQKILEVIQGFSFKDMYLWDLYEYLSIAYKYFNSEYRKKVLGGIVKCEKPSIKRISGETDFSDESAQNRGVIPSIRISFTDGSHIQVYDTDWVIFIIDNEREYDIAQVREIKADEHLDRVSSLQKLDDIMEPLSVLIEQNEHKDSEYEQFLRQSFFELGQISFEERNSEVALWKILLAHKVEENSSRNVYLSIMGGLRESEQVKFNTFVRWYDKESQMILPLQKACQRQLFDYLGFSSTSPYLRIMRAKKISVVNGTRKKNTMMQEFMVDLLLSDSDEDIIDKYRDAEINDFLQFSTTDDIKSLRELLEIDKQIKLKPVKKD